MPSNGLSTKDVAGNKTGLTSHIYPKEMKAYIHAKTGMQMFITAFFIIDKNHPNVHQLENGSTSYGMSM